MKPAILTTLLTSTAAFAPSIKSTSSTTSYLQPSTTTDASTEVSTVVESRPMWDPFGLYPTDSQERTNGRMEALEQTTIDIDETCSRPLEYLYHNRN